ncbi:MAG: hypothetical protein EOO90_12230 [Pedobacter sp.]|nr:MAG: hypothetical protein EOO90_12230 [Pedobacter sp.]
MAQKPSTIKSDLEIISSIEIGASTYNTNIFETALLIGFRDKEELATIELGYVYTQILNRGIGHHPGYHGMRGAIEVSFLDCLGTYGVYDIIAGNRWLYDDISGNGLKVHRKVSSEGTLGIFFLPKRSLLKFYAGIEPRHYNPAKIKSNQSPHKSTSINLKIKYMLDL